MPFGHPVFYELAYAADVLIGAEDIGTITPLWRIIDTDAGAAVEFREMLARRRRWALDYTTCMTVFRRQIVGGYRSFLAAIPDDIGEADEDSPFSVPLSALLADPAEAIEQLVLATYDNDVFRLDLFKKLRERFATNILVASGFPPDTDPREVQHKLVLPTAHKSRDPDTLAELYLGGTPFEDVLAAPIPFRILDHGRFEHCHIIGGTGHGKTQLLQRMIYSDLEAARRDGRSVVVIDSQGDLIGKLTRLALFDLEAADSLADRLVLIDPSDVEFPASLNLFAAPTRRLTEYRPVDQERVLNGIIELYETFFGTLLGAELTQKQGVIFRYLARLMLAIPDATIFTLMQLMQDGKPFRPYMQQLDGSARYFFEHEFFDPSFSATKKQILKRLWGVLSTPAFERMFAQKENKLDLFTAMNDGKIILVSTAKDLLKDEGSALFGRFFIAMIAQAALERSTIPEDERTPTFVYVDEAQEYFDDKIETILAQGRKYKVGFHAAHQTLDQLSPRLRSAFLANTSLKCAGGVSARDARALADELHTDSAFLESMRRKREHTEFAVWQKNLTDRALRLSVPLGFVERQPTLDEEAYDTLIELNRARYCGTRADILDFPMPERADPEARRPAPPAPPQPPATPPDMVGTAPERLRRPPPPPVRESADTPSSGKGGPKHRYLQSLVKELGEAQGFKAVIEAPIPGGQIDVLLTQGATSVAVEISITTPVEAEVRNLHKCLAETDGHVAVVLAKSKRVEARYRQRLIDALSAEQRKRVSFLTPEELPDYIAALAPAPEMRESTVRGYRVRVSHASVSPDEAKLRRDTLAKVIARTLARSED